MKKHEKTELGKFQEEYQNFFLGPALREALEGQDPAVQKEISNLIYDTEGLSQLEKGFNVILENLARVPGGQLVKQELTAYGLTLMKDLEELASIDPNEIVKKMQQVRDAITEDMRHRDPEPTQGTESFIDLLQQTRSLKDECKISDTSFGIMYEIGCLLFAEQNFEKATSVFHFLTILDTKCHEAFFSLALCHQKSSHWPLAIANYAIAIATGPENMNAYINSALCYAALHDPAKAKYMLDLALAVLKRIDVKPEERIQISDHIKRQLKKVA